MITLRDYQTKTIESVFSEWTENQSTIAVLPTGSGKTTIFSEIARRMQPKKSLILVHREELLTQAKDRLKNQADLDFEVEKAEQKAIMSVYSHGVVASVQTLYSSEFARLKKFDPNDFGLVIADECHRYVAPNYRKVVDYFRSNEQLKILGVTATPDRADEEALGQIFQTVAFDYEILDAIHDGWLVPVDQLMVNVEGLDFSDIKTTAGDLNMGELSDLMEREQVMQGVAAASINIIGTKRTLAFCSSVRHAEMLSEIFNRHRPGMSDWICGATPKEDRKRKLAAFKSGEIQVICNCGILTEGYDCPEVEIIIQARPTKSRALYAQIIGRSLRTLPGVVDNLLTPTERKTAILQSLKPSALIIDFVGNAGRHKLISSADILGGNVSEDVINRAVKKAKKEGKPLRMDQLLEEEQKAILKEIEERKQREAAARARLIGKVRFSTSKINPFDVFQIEPHRSRGWDAGKSLSEKQKGLMLKIGLNPDDFSYAQSRQILNEQFRRWNDNLCSLKQAAWLKKNGYETNIKMKEASAIMDSWAKNGWKRPSTNLI